MLETIQTVFEPKGSRASIAPPCVEKVGEEGEGEGGGPSEKLFDERDTWHEVSRRKVVVGTEHDSDSRNYGKDDTSSRNKHVGDVAWRDLDLWILDGGC